MKKINRFGNVRRPSHISRDAFVVMEKARTKVSDGKARYATRFELDPVSGQVQRIPGLNQTVNLKSMIAPLGYQLGEKVVIETFIAHYATHTLMINGITPEIVKSVLVSKGMVAPEITKTVLETIQSVIGIDVEVVGKGKRKTYKVNPYLAQQTMVAWLKGRKTTVTSARHNSQMMVNMAITVIPAIEDSSPDAIFDLPSYGTIDTVLVVMDGVPKIIVTNATLRKFNMDDADVSFAIQHTLENEKTGPVPFTTLIDELLAFGEVSIEKYMTGEQLTQFLRNFTKIGLDRSYWNWTEIVTKVNAAASKANQISTEIQRTIGTGYTEENLKTVSKLALRTDDGVNTQVDQNDLVSASVGSSFGLSTVAWNPNNGQNA